jgi:osmotically-inducible protein OsmY
MLLEAVAHAENAVVCAVTEQARRRLRNSGHPAVRRVSCQYDDGVLVLHGRLGTFFHKQVAQEAVTGLAGVHRVQNEIEVVYSIWTLPDPDFAR